MIVPTAMSNRDAYPRRGIEPSREQLRERNHKQPDDDAENQCLRIQLNAGIKRFYEARGQEQVSGAWGGGCAKKRAISEIVPQTGERREVIRTKWVRRKQNPEPSSPRYVPTVNDRERINIINNARQIVQDAERKGLVTRSAAIPNGGQG
mgnify:CR=1 FL=1